MEIKSNDVNKFPKFEWKENELSILEQMYIHNLNALFSSNGTPLYIVRNLEDIPNVPDCCIGITAEKALQLIKAHQCKLADLKGPIPYLLEKNKAFHPDGFPKDMVTINNA